LEENGLTEDREYEITEDKEIMRNVEIEVQLKMIQLGVTKKDAYAWYSNDLIHKPPPNNKPGWYRTKSDSELTVEERESKRICISRWKREVEKEQERARSGQEDEKENEFEQFDSTNRERVESYIVCRGDLDCAIWVIRNRTEYDRLIKLHEMAIAYGKLLSQYGFNAVTGDWNEKLFPVTPTDAQMKEIRSDMDAYKKALSNVVEYSQYLGRKYSLEVGDFLSTRHYKEWIFYYQPTAPINVNRDMAITYCGDT
jgi:hypothetical protein